MDVRYAVLDVGTNSVKLLIAEGDPVSGWHTIVDRAEVTRLGEGIEETGAIAPAAIERTATAFASMVADARSARVAKIVAIGTAGMRMASNTGAVVDEVRRRSGVTIEVISGDEESRLAFWAVRMGVDLGERDIVVFDTGGGSSQFTFGRGSEVLDRLSVDVGAVKYTEAFALDRAADAAVVNSACARIAADLAVLDRRERPETMVAIGGAVTTIASVALGLEDYDPDVVSGSTLARSEVRHQIDLYASTDAEGRRTIPGLQPGREVVILAGACIVHTVMEKLGQATATVSDRGLRHGVLVERFGR